MSFTAKNLGALRSLAERNQLRKFRDFWAPDYKDTMPMKAAYTPESLISGNVALTYEYDGWRSRPNEPALFSDLARAGRVIHTLRREYISDDDNMRMSKEFEEHVKVVLAPLEARSYGREHLFATLGASRREH